jgi:hypothetical protein
MTSAALAHLRLPIVLAASLLMGVAGDEWLTCWLSHNQPANSTSLESVPHSAAPQLSTAAVPVRHPATQVDLASSSLD